MLNNYFVQIPLFHGWNENLQIQSKTYSSYPKDFTNEIDARQYTAKLALEELIKDAEKEQFVLLSTEGDVLARIPPIVEKHFHGIWSWQLEADYLDLFQEQLPKNWLEVVDMSPCISVEPCLNDRFVLRFCKPEEVRTFAILCTGCLGLILICTFNSNKRSGFGLVLNTKTAHIS